MRTRRPLALRLLFFGCSLFVSSALVGCNRQNREAWPDDTSRAAHEPDVVMITAEPVKFRQVQRTVEAVGTTWGYEEVTISAKVDGRVSKLVHDVADRVKPGELLLEIDPTDYDLAARQAERSLQVDLAKLGLTEPPGSTFDITQVPLVVQANARMENAKARLERIKASQSAASREELAEKETESRVAEAEYKNQVLVARSGLATIQVKQEALAIARQQLKDTEIRAPVPTAPIAEGVEKVTYAITRRSVAEGSYAKSGMEVIRLVIDRPLKLRVPVPERHTRDVKVSQKVQVFTEGYDKPFSGTVTRINPSVEPVTRTFEVEIRVPNTKGELKPGSFAKAAIITREEDKAITVPLEALVTFAGITKVFLADNGQAKEVPVTLGVQGNDWVEILDPRLQEGAPVITSGQTALADGTRVALRPSAEDGKSKPPAATARTTLDTARGTAP